MAATDSPETTTTREPEAPRATASPLDQHAPPTASAGGSSGRATASLILGIISIPAALIALLGIILGVVALVLGATARGDIRRRNLTNSGPRDGGHHPRQHRARARPREHDRRRHHRHQLAQRDAVWIASTASSVSASAAGLSGRWRSTRANRSATPPG